MENASKALIIAGAILISIIIIGLGVYFVNMAQAAGKKVNLNGQAATAQNSQFTAYFGEKVTASEVKALMGLISTNNITGQNEDDQKFIFVSYGGTLTLPTTVSRNVKPGKTYKVYTNNDYGDDTMTSYIKAAAEGTTSTAIKVDTSKKIDADTDSSYYTSGYLKIISIQEN